MLIIMLIAIAETLSLHVSQMYKRGTRLNAKCDIKIKVIQYLRYNTHERVTNTHIHSHAHAVTTHTIVAFVQSTKITSEEVL